MVYTMPCRTLTLTVLKVAAGPALRSPPYEYRFGAGPLRPAPRRATGSALPAQVSRYQIAQTDAAKADICQFTIVQPIECAQRLL